MADLVSTPAYRLAAELRAGAISSVEIVEAYLDRISALDTEFHSFIEVYDADARNEAAEADRSIRRGQSRGPLHGMPVALKDMIALEGKATSCGSLAKAGGIAPRNAELAARLTSQGMIVLGKTHLVEFAMGGWGTNCRMGTPRNPWSRSAPLAPGGSSSGSAVAVAGLLTPWSVGTDTGGSVRIPASWCGIAGLKATAGQIGTAGIQSLSQTLDSVGPLARCVEDVELLYGAMLDQARVSRAALPRDDLIGIRVGRMPATERDIAAPEVLSAYDRSLDELSLLGAEVVDVSLPCGFAELAELNGVIMAAEGYSNFSDLVEDLDAPMDEDVRVRLRRGSDISSHAYLGALRARATIQRDFLAALGGVHALLTPTTATVAPTLNAIDHTKTPAHYTRVVNFIGFCALSIPNGRSGDLPTSQQIICAPHCETTALRIGRAYQAATDWHMRFPPSIAPASEAS